MYYLNLNNTFKNKNCSVVLQLNTYVSSFRYNVRQTSRHNVYRRQTASCICDCNIVAVLIADGGSLLQCVLYILYIYIIYYQIEVGNGASIGYDNPAIMYCSSSNSAMNALKVYIYIYIYIQYAMLLNENKMPKKRPRRRRPILIMYY